MAEILDNQDQQTPPLPSGYTPVKQKDSQVPPLPSGYTLKKKESSEPTSQEGAGASPARPTQPGTSSDTEPPTRAQASVALGGPTKLFGQEEETHPTSIMWGNEPKKEGFVPLTTPIDIDQSIKYLEKKKSNPKELKRLKEEKAKMPAQKPIEYYLNKQIVNNLTPAIDQANTITDEDKSIRDSSFETDWNKTGFVNKVKQVGLSLLGTVTKAFNPATIESDFTSTPFEKYKNEVIKEATDNKERLTPEQLKAKVQEKYNNDWDTDKRAYNLSQLNYTLNDEEQKAVGEDVFNKNKDLNTSQKYFLNTANTLLKVKDNIGISLVDLDKQLSEKIKNGEVPTEDEIQSYNALKDKYKQYSEDSQNAYSKYSKNLDKVHSLETELDVFDNENLHSLEFIKRLGVGVEQLGVGAIDFTSYLANLHANATPYSAVTKSGNSDLAVYLHKKANDLRGAIQEQNKGLRDTSNRFESVLSNSVDFLTENTPMVLGLTFGGAPAMYGLAATTTGEKYGEMLNENKDYNEFQKIVSPLLHGGAMLLPLSKQLKTIQNSGRVLLAGEKEFPKIVENVYKEKAVDLFGKIKTFAGESFDLGNQLKLMTVLQEVNNGLVLGKDIDYKKLSDIEVYATAPLLHGMNKVAPYIAGKITEPFMSKEDYKVVDESTAQIFDLNKKLQTGELGTEEADIVKQTIKDISTKSEKVVTDKLDRIGKYGKETVDNILDATKQASDLREKANRVISSENIDPKQKKIVVKNLRGEYNSIEQTRSDLISGNNKNIIYVKNENDIPVEAERVKGSQYKVVENSIEKKLFEKQQMSVNAPAVEVVTSEVKGISPETSSNVANLTQDAEGNYVFYHTSPTTLETIEPSKYGTNPKNVTSAEEKTAIGRVGGVSMYYPAENVAEGIVSGNTHMVKVPESQVYDFNADPLNLIDEARAKFEKEYPGQAFTPNDQFAQVTKLANERGFKMIVGEWKDTTRAQTTEPLKPVDVKEKNGDIITKPFKEDFTSNKDKGYTSVIPETKQDKFNKVYEDIYSFKNSENKYDDLYHLKEDYAKKSQEEITKMIEDSDLPQEYKDKYQDALKYEPEQRRTELPTEVTPTEEKEPTKKYTEKAKELADKVRQTEILPDWLKANMGDGKIQGIDSNAVKEAFAKAIEKTGELMDKGVEFADAVKEAVNDLVGLLGEDKRASIEKDFADHYKSIEEPVTEEPKKENIAKRTVKSFFENDIAPMFKSKAEAVVETTKAIVHALSPKTGVAKEVITKFYELVGDRNKATTFIDKQVGEYKKTFDKMPDTERIDFIDRMKAGKPQATPELDAIAKVISKLDKDLYDEITKHNPNLAWKENHFRVLWKKVPGTEKEKYWSFLSKRPVRGSRGFFGQSTLISMSEGIEKGGVPYSTNPIEMFEMSYNDGMKYITAQRIIDTFKKDGIIKFVKSGQDVPDGYTKINDSVANVYFKTDQGMVKTGEYWIQEDPGRMLNNMLSRDYIRDTKLGTSLMGIKNFYTGIELGLSPFHAVAISLEQIASGAGIGLRKIVNLGDYKGGINDILTAPFSPKTTFSLGRNYFKFATTKEFENSPEGKSFLDKNPNAKEYLDDFFQGGGLVKQHEELKHNAYKALKESMGKDNYIGASLRALPALNEGIMDPLFNVYIPSLKVGLFMKEFPLLLAENKSRLDSGKVTREELSRKTIDAIDNRLGEMNFDNLYWNKTFKTASQFMLRSVTWKLGNIRQMGGAAPEQAAEFLSAIKENRRPNLSPKMAWLFGLSLTQVVLASVIQHMSLDDDDKDKDIKDFKDIVAPRINSADNKERVVIPTYYKDLMHFWHAPAEYVSSGVSGPFGKGIDLWNNKDFYGYNIYDETDPAYKKLVDAGKYVAPKPFSITSFQKMKEKGEPVSKQALSFFGFNKAPGYLEHSDLETEILDLYNIRNTSVKPLKMKEANDKKKEIREMYKKDIGKAQEMANEAVNEGLLRPTQVSRLFKDVAKNQDAMVFFFKKLPESDKEYLVTKMTDEEKEKFGIEKKLTDAEFKSKYGEKAYKQLLRGRELLKKGAK
jgi:hypothetical protein